ncbi:MAG: thioredoxin family protein [Acetobacteraceae bacterium]
MRRALLILLMLVAAAPGRTAESAAVTSARATARLISDTDAVAAGRPFRVALRLVLAPGWHTYWQNPGDAGAAPEIAVEVPDGSSVGPIAWPVPRRVPEGPVMTYAYTGEVVLPLEITPGTGAQHIDVAANWLVCERLCVPEAGRFTLDLPSGAPAPSAQAKLFAATDALMPRPSPFAARVAGDGTLSLSGEGLSPATVRDAWFFPASAGLVDQADRPAEVRAGVVAIPLRPARDFAAASGLAGVVVLRDAGGQESALAVEAAPGGAPAGTGLDLGRMLLAAALGGLLLNLMPCVFPILAMKAMAVARLSGQERRRVRAHALSYTAGVVLTFAALGLVLLVARAAGSATGWGFQLQSPAFVAVMAWVLFLVGLNLSGVFQIGPGFAGVGQGLAGRGGHVGSFATGALAVLVATPCTAPFMGTAIAAALAAPVAATVLIFVALGLGMAAPYAVLALAPGLVGLLPRPGRWMDVLRGGLAFPMYGAAAWLVWVVSLQAGSSGVLAVASGMVLLGFGAWSLGLAQWGGGRPARLGRLAALLALVATGAVLAGIAASPLEAARPGADTAERFTPARLDALRAEGRPVFVNMTAAWCVTCLVNERLALAPDVVRQAFAEHGVAYLKGDWTRGDPAITAYLRAHDRDGVPLYVLYKPGAPPRVLPQILTQSEMLSELAQLGG